MANLFKKSIVTSSEPERQEQLVEYFLQAYRRQVLCKEELAYEYTEILKKNVKNYKKQGG